MIAVIIPVHNEEALLAICLASVMQAASHHAIVERGCVVIVVLDSCSDRSSDIAAQFNVVVLETSFRAVGATRAFGAAHAISLGAVWLACTDADTCVDANWLAAQLAVSADVVCGTVQVAWPDTRTRAQADFEAKYSDCDGHRHIHGANLGISVTAYLEVGGFSARETNEDVDLVQALIARDKNIAWSAAPRVVTSARVQGRAPMGFAVGLSRFCDAMAPNVLACEQVAG